MRKALMHLTTCTLTYTLFPALSKARTRPALVWRPTYVMTLLFGCIADDLTGATDIAATLSDRGIATRLHMGVPAPAEEPNGATAQVIALKTRTIAPKQAVAESLAAAMSLSANGAETLYFKYCSTFDSTCFGNIGPVTDALLEFTGSRFTVLAPAFPATGRTVRDGVLHVLGVPLAESPMRRHPLTPMTESFVPELMDRQTAADRTGLIDLATVRSGAKAVTQAWKAIADEGKRYAVVDTETDQDLTAIAEACDLLPLVTGSSALAGALAERRTATTGQRVPTALPELEGHCAILAGSCSEATRRQIATDIDARRFQLDPLSLVPGSVEARQWSTDVVTAAREGNVLVSSSAPSDQLQHTQRKLGVSAAADRVEALLAEVAVRLDKAGIRKFIVAGGETSGAVAAALTIRTLAIGPTITAGVPWMFTTESPQRLLAFKSGNFGGDSFFSDALAMVN